MTKIDDVIMLSMAWPMLVCDFMIIAPSVWRLFRFRVISLLMSEPILNAPEVLLTLGSIHSQHLPHFRF